MTQQQAHEHRDPGVVVGVDGTDAALRAVVWAVAEARARHLSLTIVHAAPYAVSPSGRARARAILARAYTLAHRRAPDLDVHTERLDEAPVPALVAAADRAALLVLGMIGGSRVEDAFIGSLAPGIAGRASCPVVVVRGTPHPAERPVVVGVQDPDRDAAALTVAFADARRHRTPVIVLHARHGADAIRDRVSRHGTEDTAAEADRLAAALAPWRSRFPEVEVDLQVVSGRPIDAVLERAVTARLVVLGTHRRGGPGRALLGSTGRAVLRSSPCPVAVVAPDVTSEGRRAAMAAPAWANRPHDPGELW